MALAIGVDVGGTKVAAGVVDETGQVVAAVRRPTPSYSPADTAATIVGCVRELAAAYDVTAVGIGAAGFVSADRGTVLFAPNLAWRDEPLRERIADAVGLPVAVENDANAAAWAEYRFGAGVGERHLVVITVGTGIGGGIVLDGRLQRGAWGMAGEPGHMRAVPGGLPCGCGRHGCWEQYASGNALTQLARERAAALPEPASALLALAGGDPAAVTGPHVTTAARDGDVLARGVLADVGDWLGSGLADLAAVLDPGAFVVGGGVAEAGDLLLGPARAAYARELTGAAYRPLAEIRAARLGNDAGLVGAADLARVGP